MLHRGRAVATVGRNNPHYVHRCGLPWTPCKRSRWASVGDFDWGNRQIHIQRGFVIGHVDEVKMANSNRSLPVHSALATLLLEEGNRTRRKGHRLAFSKPSRNGEASMAVDDPANSLTTWGKLMPDGTGLAGTRFGILTRPCSAPCEWI